MWANGFRLPSEWKIKLFARLAHPTNLPCWHTYHERKVWDVPVYQGSSADEREIANLNATNNGAIRAGGRALENDRITILVLALDQ